MVAGIRKRRADPWYRSFVSGVYNRVVRISFGIRERDFDCGLKTFTREVWDSVTPIRARSAVFNPEMFFKAHRMGFRVIQMEVEHLPRLAGRRSGGRLIPVARAMRDVIRLRVSLADELATGGRPPGARLVRRAAIPGLLTLAVLRLPSLMEPHWYTDEAGYLNVARELLTGKILYSQTWNNKPPLMLWTMALDFKLFGSSEIALHVLTLISGLVTIAAIVWAAGRLYTPRRALVAGVIAAVVLGMPLVDAELALPESLMIAPLSWAGAIVLVAHPAWRSDRRARDGSRAGRSRRACSWQRRSPISRPRSPRRRRSSSRCCWRRSCSAATPSSSSARSAAITVVWLTAAIITAGAGNVAYALAGFYVGYTQQTLPKSAAGGLAHFALALGAALLIAAGAIASRHRPRVDWVLALWAGATLVVTAVAGQPYPHFLAPAVAPLTLLVAGLPVPVAELVPRAQQAGRWPGRVCSSSVWWARS